MIIHGSDLTKYLKNKQHKHDSSSRGGMYQPEPNGWCDPGTGEETQRFTFYDSDKLILNDQLLKKNGWVKANNQPTTLEDAMSVINDYLQQGWSITYDIIDQEKNGYWHQDPADNLDTLEPRPHFTVTSIVIDPRTTDHDPVVDLQATFDTIPELYLWLATELPKYADKTADAIAESKQPIKHQSLKELDTILYDSDPEPFQKWFKQFLIDMPSSKGYQKRSGQPYVVIDEYDGYTDIETELKMIGGPDELTVGVNIQDDLNGYDYYSYHVPVDSIKHWLADHQWDGDADSLIKLVADKADVFEDSELEDEDHGS